MSYNMNPFKNLIDNIFSVPESILNLAIQKMAAAGTVMAQGINISKWLGPVAWLGPTWVKVVNALLSGATIVLIVWIAKRIYMIYLNAKEGVRWW